MVGLRIKTRQTGARAVMAAGQATPVITTPTGGQLEVVTRVEQPGFNPLDLLHSSLAACMALSLRIAANELKWGDRLGAVTVDITGEKAEDGPSRLARFNLDVTIAGPFTDHEREQLIARAEAICTVSNTLRTVPAFAHQVTGA